MARINTWHVGIEVCAKLMRNQFRLEIQALTSDARFQDSRADAASESLVKNNEILRNKLIRSYRPLRASSDLELIGS